MNISTYPRKGTETASCGSPPKPPDIHFNLSPQGDGNGLLCLRSNRCRNFNLSPQGDGNEECCISFVRCHPFQLILARGRKHRFSGTAAARNGHFNLPPQGDGNISSMLTSTTGSKFQLIPARGRKPLRSGGNVGFCNISTYPRKGTKNSASKRCGVFLLQTLTLCFPWAIPL